MNVTLVFDGYGILVDPSCMAKHLADDQGPQAAGLADFWREKSGLRPDVFFNPAPELERNSNDYLQLR
jgi:hypothetical protein